jgi:hypothetical protein
MEQRLLSIESNQIEIINYLKEIRKTQKENDTKINAIHKHVPFVDWLDDRRKSLQSVFSVGDTMRTIGHNISPIFSQEVVETFTDSQNNIQDMKR